MFPAQNTSYLRSAHSLEGQLISRALRARHVVVDYLAARSSCHTSLRALNNRHI